MIPTLTQMTKPMPKPTRANRPKKSKNHVHGICPQCAMIFHSPQPQHERDCPQEIPVIMVRKNQTERQLVEMALDELCRLITIWRDGCDCVLQGMYGANCGGVSQWGHVVPQGKCKFLVYELSNSFRQCANHNGEHRFVQLSYFQWYKKKFGTLALEMLDKARIDNPVCNLGIVDYYEKLNDLNGLYAMRNSVSLELEHLIDMGYYGSIIREAWIKEGRI